MIGLLELFKFLTLAVIFFLERKTLYLLGDWDEDDSVQQLRFWGLCNSFWLQKNESYQVFKVSLLIDSLRELVKSLDNDFCCYFFTIDLRLANYLAYWSFLELLWYAFLAEEFLVSDLSSESCQTPYMVFVFEMLLWRNCFDISQF